MKSKLLVIGGGAGARLATTYSNYSQIAVYSVFCTLEPRWLEIKSFSSAVSLINEGETDYFIGTGDNIMREEHFIKFTDATGKVPCNIVHHSAIVEDGALLGSGILICPNAVVNINAKIEDGVIINTNSTVEHDCHCEAFSQISPGAVLAGGCRVGRRAFVGAGSTLLPKVAVERDAIVGAGSVVTRNIPPQATVKGSPAR